MASSSSPYIRISKDVLIPGQSLLVLDPVHYTSLFNAWIYQFSNIPELCNKIGKLSDLEVNAKPTLKALRTLFNKRYLLEQIKLAKTVLMLGSETYHPESPFSRLPKPILHIIIQECNGAEGRSLIKYPPQIHQESPLSLILASTVEDKHSHLNSWFWQFYDEAEPYLDNFLGKELLELESACGHKSIHTNNVTVLELPLKKSITESLQYCYNDEKLVHDNKYSCHKCKGEKYDAVLKSRLAFPPHFLLIQMQRNVFNLTTCVYEWNNSAISVDATLDISSVLSPVPEAPPLYQLHSLILGYRNFVGCSAVIKDMKNDRWLFYKVYKGYLDVEVVTDMEKELINLGMDTQSQFAHLCVLGVVYKKFHG